MGSKKLTRPNKKCLTCDSEELKQPTTLRKFMYCGRDCADHANMKINIFAVSGLGQALLHSLGPWTQADDLGHGASPSPC